jgi:hypothetical protein
MQNGLVNISPEKEDWFSTPRSNGMKLLINYASTDMVTPENLDIAFNNWSESVSDKKPAEVVIGYGLGVLFGDYMIAQAGGKWMAAAADQDFELAILFDNGAVAYPIDSVWKRMPKNADEVSFFEPIWNAITRELSA